MTTQPTSFSSGRCTSRPVLAIRDLDGERRPATPPLRQSLGVTWEVPRR
jgi:hypothetical protein